MKKILYLFVLVTALSCSEQVGKNNVEATSTSVSPSGNAGKWNSKTFAGVLGIVNKADESMSFRVEQKVLLASFNNFLKTESNIDANLKSLSLVKSNGEYYLRGYGDEYKSTMLLNKDSGGNLTSGKVTCTTSSCSASHGCEVKPDGTCSHCSGNCTKTTSME